MKRYRITDCACCCIILCLLANGAPGQETAAGIDGAVALLPIEWSPDVKEAVKRENPGLPETVRQTFSAAFGPLGYQDIDLDVVDERLAAAGLDTPGKRNEASAVQLAKALKCRGVLSGQITKFQNQQTLLYNRIMVEAMVTLTEVPSGEIVWSKAQKQVLSGGVLLNSGQARDLLAELSLSGQKVSREVQMVVAELVGKIIRTMPPPRLRRVDRPEVKSIAASVNGQTAGRVRVTAGRALALDVTGTPKCRGVFDLPGVHRGIPLIEVEDGHYRGLYVFQDGDLHGPTTLDVRLTNSLGITGKRNAENTVLLQSARDAALSSEEEGS